MIFNVLIERVAMLWLDGFRWKASLWFFIFFCPIVHHAQPSNNPFELIDRLAPQVQKRIEEKRSTGAPENPFDVVKNGVELVKPTAAPPIINNNKASAAIETNPTLDMPSSERDFRKFLFLMILVMLILLVLALTLFRNYIIKSYQSFWSENRMNQVYREKSGGMSFPYYVLYGLFFLNAGIFLFWYAHHEGVFLSENNLIALGLCVGGASGFFMLHHVLLRICGFIFPIAKDTDRYDFTVQVFNIVIGVILVPIILLLAYSPSSLLSFLLPMTLFILLAIYGYRYLRGLFIANRYLAFHKFHFLLYICAVEIAPFIILLKWLQ